MDVVGPQFGFHDHRELRLQAVEKVRRRPRQIVGQVAVLNLIAEQRTDALGAGRGHAGYGDRQLGMALSDRYGMYPDTAGLQRRHLEGEALGDALAVGRRLASAQVQAQGDQRQGQMEQQAVEGTIHGRGGYQLATVLWWRAGHTEHHALAGST
ncbi:hypothetical protein D3C75_897610 [compost metagenome]